LSNGTSHRKRFFWAAVAVPVLVSVFLAAWRFIPATKQPGLVSAEDHIKFVQKHTGAVLEPLDRNGREWRSDPAGGLGYSLRLYRDGTYEIGVSIDASACGDLLPVKRLVNGYIGEKAADGVMAAVADRLALAAQRKIEPRESRFCGAGDRRATVASNSRPDGRIVISVILWRQA